MADYENITDIRHLEEADIKKLTKPDLIKALKTAVTHITEESKFDQILIELKSLKEERENDRSEIKKLKEDNELCHKILAQHQKILESLDAERRASNLIVSGLREDQPLQDDNNSATEDVEKVSLIFTKLGLGDIQVEKVDRLGNQNTNKKRPLKVILKNKQERWNILEKARTLKNFSSPFSDIYINKDVSPSVRNEFKRLREVTKREKQKAENMGRNVFLNYKERKVYVDDVVIDSYKPNFF